MRIVSPEYRKQIEAATSLCDAIAECHDLLGCHMLRQIIEAGLKDLRAEMDFTGNPFFREAVSHYRAERSRSGRVI